MKLLMLLFVLFIAGCSHIENFDYDLHIVYVFDAGFWGSSESIELFGDGKYIIRGTEDFEEIKERKGRLKKEDMEKLINEINKGFFELPENIFNEDCLDGGTKTLKIELNGRSYRVEIYCDSNEVFDNVVNVLRGSIPEN